jgi:hypothetical protein
VYLKLPADYVDRRTHAPLAGAVLVIADTEFRLRAGDTRVLVAIYATPEALAGGALPIDEYPIALGPGERDSQLPALLLALYSVVAARPEYHGSDLVP